MRLPLVQPDCNYRACNLQCLLAVVLHCCWSEVSWPPKHLVMYIYMWSVVNVSLDITNQPFLCTILSSLCGEEPRFISQDALAAPNPTIKKGLSVQTLRAAKYRRILPFFSPSTSNASSPLNFLHSDGLIYQVCLTKFTWLYLIEISEIGQTCSQFHSSSILMLNLFQTEIWHNAMFLLFSNSQQNEACPDSTDTTHGIELVAILFPHLASFLIFQHLSSLSLGPSKSQSIRFKAHALLGLLPVKLH